MASLVLHQSLSRDTMKEKADKVLTARETFLEVLKQLGFSKKLPFQMSNSDYWLCTTTAMERFANQERERIRKEIEEAKYPSNGYDYELGYNSGLDTALSLLSPTSKPTT